MKQTRAAGFVIATLGVIAVGPDAAMLRLQEASGGTTSVIAVWRYLLLAACNALAAPFWQGGCGPFLEGMAASPLQLLGASAVIVLINAGFTISLLWVDAAIAQLLISLPFERALSCTSFAVTLPLSCDVLASRQRRWTPVVDSASLLRPRVTGRPQMPDA